MAQRRARIGAAVLAAAAVLAGCAGGPGADDAPQAPPPAPPAACLLDTAALATATGLRWTPDQSTASDTRCVYDPAPAESPTSSAPISTAADPSAAATGAEGSDFVAVDIAPFSGDAAAELDTVAALCQAGSRAPAGSGFVCRFEGESVFAATTRGSNVITVALSAIPEGTTAARLVLALGEQIGALR